MINAWTDGQYYDVPRKNDEHNDNEKIIQILVTVVFYQFYNIFVPRYRSKYIIKRVILTEWKLINIGLA